MGWLLIILVLVGLVFSFGAKMYDLSLFFAIVGFIMIWFKMRKKNDAGVTK